MKPQARTVRTTLLVAAMCATAAHAALDRATDRQVGGVFSNACDDPKQLRIRLYEDVLDVERGGTAVKASKLQVTKTAPAGAPWPDFKLAVSGQVKGGGAVSLVLSHNAQGLFARLEGSDRALAPLGANLVGQTLRHCDPNRNALPGAAAAKPEVPQHPAELLKDARFKSAYLKALGPLSKEPWLARLNGPASPMKTLQFGGAEHLVGAPCKPHDCADNTMLLLYTPATGAVAGKIVQGPRSTTIGAPSPELARELDRLWKLEFNR